MTTPNLSTAAFEKEDAKRSMRRWRALSLSTGGDMICRRRMARRRSSMCAEPYGFGLGLGVGLGLGLGFGFGFGFGFE